MSAPRVFAFFFGAFTVAFLIAGQWGEALDGALITSLLLYISDLERRLKERPQ